MVSHLTGDLVRGNLDTERNTRVAYTHRKGHVKSILEADERGLEDTRRDNILILDF